MADILKPKVLLVDDDPLMHALYKPHIERAGYEVVSLMDGDEACRVAGREQPRVVVIDMLMPGTDGLSGIMLLKAMQATSGIPIIAISGDQSYHGLQQQLHNAGVDAFLSKPFGAARLVSEIRSLDKLRGSPT